VATGQISTAGTRLYRGLRTAGERRSDRLLQRLEWQAAADTASVV